MKVQHQTATLIMQWCVEEIESSAKGIEEVFIFDEL